MALLIFDVRVSIVLVSFVTLLIFDVGVSSLVSEISLGTVNLTRWWQCKVISLAYWVLDVRISVSIDPQKLWRTLM